MDEGALVLVLPWPSRQLSPNARVNWRVKHRATQDARQTALLLALRAGWRGVHLPEGRLRLELTFYPPDRRRVDDDNMVGRFKPYRDGLAQALGIDDGRFKSFPDVAEEVREGGEVVVRITALARQAGNSTIGEGA